ncbi:MAG: four helix bundle protein [Betaproteobacteria bacterium]|nr:MAG: four helix bundle protein [Betaproteobacteria bacterium]
MRRGAVSVPSNIAEGAAGTSTRALAHYLMMVDGSLSDIDAQLAFAITLGYVQKEDEIQETLDWLPELIGGSLNPVC